jgi:hypothetical protein
MALLFVAPYAYSPAASAACTAADLSIYKSKGEANFDSDMQTCGKKCLGGSSCVEKCIETAEGYSDACSACFGDLAGCTKDKCWIKCIGGESASCKSCVESSCDASFTTCSGITPPQATWERSVHGLMDEVKGWWEADDSCTGAGNPTVPVCYSGSDTIIGMKEEVEITVKTFDATKNTGTLDITATGVSPESCKDKAFTKSGQTITMDVADCMSGATVEAKYCSDQDSVVATIKVGKLPLPAVTVTMAKTPCPTVEA